MTMTPTPRPAVALITCDVLRTEFSALVPSRPHVIHTEILEQGLHNTPARLREVLQQAVWRIEDQVPCAHILIGYGLCSRGIEGVVARRCSLVFPRAHDCITLLLGSKERYADYVARHPGCYWYSPGWNRCHVPPGPQRHAALRQQYSERFEAEDVDFLMETEQHWFKTYSLATYVDVGIGVTPADLAYTQECAKWLGWQFDHQQGDPALLCELLDGPWHPERFLVLKPGATAVMTADAQVITSSEKDGCDVG